MHPNTTCICSWSFTALVMSSVWAIRDVLENTHNFHLMIALL